MSRRLDGKVALIAGPADAGGRTQALRFAKEGADIVVLGFQYSDRSSTNIGSLEQHLAETVRLVEATGSRICAFETDVRDQEALDAAVAAGVDALGQLDIVCATAGPGSSGAVLELDARLWQAMLDINFNGIWRICKSAIPHIISGGRGGSIVLISSIAGLRGLTEVGLHTTTEHGIVGLMKSLANELATHRVRVNTIHPTRTLAAGLASEASQTMHLLPVAGIEPEDVANASLFLASDEARYITGVALPVDAGHCVK